MESELSTANGELTRLQQEIDRLQQEMGIVVVRKASLQDLLAPYLRLKDRLTNLGAQSQGTDMLEAALVQSGVADDSQEVGVWTGCNIPLYLAPDTPGSPATPPYSPVTPTHSMEEDPAIIEAGPPAGAMAAVGARVDILPI